MYREALKKYLEMLSKNSDSWNPYSAIGFEFLYQKVVEEMKTELNG